jgi:16S rRNA (cytosine1402-N4)-methyltransferase
MHVPVMSAEALEYLAVRPDGAYLDATCGMAGHTRLIAERLKTGFVIACDRDPESLEMARRNCLEVAARVRFWEGTFSRLAEAPGAFGVGRVDGLLADLGVSRYQLTSPERGFSLQSDGPLDMRLNRASGLTAAEIVNTFAERDIADLLYRLGDERRWSRKIAGAIVRARPIRGTLHLAQVVESVVYRTGKLHPATKTFMALRLAVNREQEELDALLDTAPALVKAGGRIVVISFMSLEDRKVKESFRRLAREQRVRLLTKHVVKPGEQETRSNPPSRSARLRAVEMCAAN